jgi:hypothetical protein
MFVLAPVKGANIGVGARLGEGWEDRGHGLLLSLLPSGPCLVRLFVAAAACMSRTSSCSCCDTSSRFSAARSPGRSSGILIGLCSQPRRPICRVRRAAHAWSRRGRCCVGIGRLCDESGGSLQDSAGGRSCRTSFGSWCYSSRARIRAGATGGSAVSWPSSACGCRRRASAAFSLGRDSIRRHGGQGRAGASSCTRRRRASSRAISSPSRACSCAATTRCSSSRTRAAASGLRAARGIQRRLGDPASPQPRPRLLRAGHPFSHPRPRQQVQRPFRSGFPQ